MIVQNESQCQNDINMPPQNASKLNYLNAVYCVGNYQEIFKKSFGVNRNEINHINNGTGERARVCVIVITHP
jgi:hypothetical protein